MNRRYLKKLLTNLFILGIGMLTYAQKPAITNESFKSWPELKDYSVSNDGKYVWYIQGSLNDGNSLTIKAIDNPFILKVGPLNGKPKFSYDSQFVMYMVRDTLNVFNLGTRTRRKISAVSYFSMPEDRNSNWFIVQSNGSCYLQNLSSGKQINLGSKSCKVNADGTLVAIERENPLDLMELPSTSVRRIFEGASISNVVFDASGKNILFTSMSNDETVLRYYTSDMKSSYTLLDKVLVQGGRKGKLTGIPFFNREGTLIFANILFESAEIEQNNFARSSELQINIWDYKTMWVSSNDNHKSPRGSVLISIDIRNRKVVQIERQDSSKVLMFPERHSCYVLTKSVINQGEQNWNLCKQSYFLINLKNGSTKEILIDAPTFTKDPELSPNDTYVTWYDYKLSCYRSYEIETGIIRSITKSLPFPVAGDPNDAVGDQIGGFYGNFWMADGSALLVYDQYDIWQVDPSARKRPINITGGTGRKYRTVFKFANTEFGAQPYNDGDSALITGLGECNKKNMLCKVVLGRENQPDVKQMIRGIFYFPWIYSQPKIPVRCKFGSRYVLQYMSAESSPNIVVTDNFKSYKQISNIQPQKKFNWMSSELIHWSQADGRELQGILYKPEDFNPQKKYPVIFHYYDLSSHEVNLYRTPELSVGGLNIAWYVSNGYIVFIPDIPKLPGHPAKAAIDAAGSAVSFLTQFPWIDQQRIGLQGHSFGGYETFVLATHTDFFVAAQPSAGLTNFVSGYSALKGFWGSIYELGQNNIRALPWEKADLYLENSPLFQAGQIKAPMFIMHNKDDGAVSFSQSWEMFIALRRQKKPVWLLDYEGEGHHINNPNNQLDFAIRQQQFFGHYLKGEPMPMWMKESGNLSLDLDTAERTN